MDGRQLLTMVAVLAVTAATYGTTSTGAASTTSTGSVFRIRNVSANSTSDGIVLRRAINAPVVGADGVTVATAFATSFEAHPGLEYLPTLFEIHAGSRTVIIGGLASGTGGFRQTIGFDNLDGPVRFARANFVASADDFTIFYERLPPATAPFSTTLNHAFLFTQNRVDRLIGDTGLSYRPGNQWWLVSGFGQATLVGDNPSMSFTSLTTPPRLANVNFLRLTGGESGAVIACYDFPVVCGVKGVGDYAGIYGTASSLSPGSFGLNANAASTTDFTYRDPSSPPNPAGCPSAQELSPPLNALAGEGRRTGPLALGIPLAWDSVECAAGYWIRVRDKDGFISRTARIDKPSYLLDFDVNDRTFAVAAVGPDGTVGPFSQEFELLPFSID
jgi:hypothetical protein